MLNYVLQRCVILIEPHSTLQTQNIIQRVSRNAKIDLLGLYRYD